ncbi:MAG: hypothetical protein P4L76_01730 [Beijerinckiaceae bacterium]|nr:hypothetical protein [Beijerinckiaceae bacterium]
MIDSSVLPDIQLLDDIEIVEAKTRISIYRRLRTGHPLERKVMLFDSTVLQRRDAIRNIKINFTISYVNSERLGLETMTGILNNTTNTSVLVSGRLSYLRYRHLIQSNNYLCVALLRDPLEELAERLLLLKLMGRSAAPNVLLTYITGLDPLIEFARDLPFNDPKGLLKAFRNMDEAQRQAIVSPMVRMFGCNVGELPRPADTGAALENIASMDVVGTYSRLGTFRALLSATLGVDIFGNEAPATPSTVTALAGALAKISTVTDLLAQDLAFYSYAEEAISAAMALTP